MTAAGLRLFFLPAETVAMASVTCSTSGRSAGGFVKATPSGKQRTKSGEAGCRSADFRRGRIQLPRLNLRIPMPVTCAVMQPLNSSALAMKAVSSAEDCLADDVLHGYSPLVKMCGITSPEDASLAAQAGARYVGMIMWPHSKRSVNSFSLAKEICCAAREFGAEPVGVFVSESAGEIERACDAAGLSFAQLHGDGARASLLELPRSLRTVYVMHSDAEGCLQTTISPEQERVIDWVLVDGIQGGSGAAFAWDKFRVPAPCENKGWLLAGGLNPENVAEAISTLRPNAVDVASGIAGSDGIRKDPSRIFAFMDAVRATSGSSCLAV